MSMGLQENRILTNGQFILLKQVISGIGHESITEHLLTRLGKCFDLNMADCRLCMINGQVRFLSKYFLKPEQRLVHGAEIYAGFLSNDRDFVESIEEQQLARDFLTIQFTHDAIKSTFPEHSELIFKDFVKMLLFDALVGNNDRHFYNWAIVQHIENKNEPYFSLIYDTARGLFWNTQEINIVSLRPDSQEFKTFVAKYYKNSRPKIGLDNEENINHFDLARFIISNEFGILKEEIETFFNQRNLERGINLVDLEFQNFYSRSRLEFIKKCLIERF